MSDELESIEISLSFLQKVQDEISQSNLEDNTFFKNLEDSLAYSLQASQISSDKGALAQMPRNGKEISFDISDMSCQKPPLQPSKPNEPLGEETMPTSKYTGRSSYNLASLAISSRLFCKYCEIDTVTIVNYEIKRENWLGSLFSIFRNMKCCTEPRSAEYVVVHRCRSCSNVLARIYSAQSISELRGSRE
ncbi:hypothetical protein SteCoe_27200 [Stentor coeruleus]|uniref:LITAF domain-containing protein n=1 Tax=Stentor coeruleus TaxID=5963 RepID=A0A1R2BB34_9CILI|nr:hypothetical protein SteCoe_27200 [Stentor coeruleus]